MPPSYPLVSSELVQATGVLATVLAHVMGNSGVSAHSIRKDAVELLTTWLRTTRLPIDLHQSIIDDGGKVTPARAEWRSALQELGLNGNHADPALARIHAVLLPIDGATSLGDGRAGAMVWVALADSEALIPFRQFVDATCRQKLAAAADQYCLVVTLGSNTDPNLREGLAGLVGQEAGNAEQSVAELLKSPRVTGVFAGRRVLVASTMETPQFRYAHPTLGGPSLGRRLDGSAIVSAIAAFTQLTDVGLSVCRLPALPIIAAAARVTGGMAVAVPLSGTNSNLKVAAGAQYFGMESVLARNAQVTVAGTSVTEICVSDRVRWNACGWRPRVALEPGRPSPSFISFYSVVLDTRYALFEERATHLDIARVMHGEETLDKVVSRYKARWDAAVKP